MAMLWLWFSSHHIPPAIHVPAAYPLPDFPSCQGPDRHLIRVELNVVQQITTAAAGV